MLIDGEVKREDVDYMVAGVVRVRLVAATAGDQAVVERQLGPSRTQTSGEPDIVVRFTDAIERPSPAMTFVEWQETAFSGSDFYLTRGRAGARGLTRLAFDEVGQGVELLVERSSEQVPHLLALVNLVALARGVLPLHATAFEWREMGVLVTGWAKGGKTETLLAMSEMGARYIGDEWIYLTHEGTMLGVPEPLRLWHWHVGQLPRIRDRIPQSTKLRLSVLSRASAAAEWLGREAPVRAVRSVMRRVSPIVRRQAYTHVSPLGLFGSPQSGKTLDVVIFATTSSGSEISVLPADAADVAARMRASLIEEREPLLRHYRHFRFAFPDRRSTLIDRAEQIERELLHEVLAPRPALHLTHPYPFELEAIATPLQEALALLPRQAEQASLGAQL